MAEQVFSWLLEKGASILSDDKEENSDILLKAVKDGDLNIVTLLAGVVTDMNKMKFEGESLLSLAAFSGHTNVVKCLVSKGADVEGIDDDGLTALHVASREGHLEVVRFLVSEGGDINRQTFDGMTPLTMASKRGHVAVLEYLISNGAEVERSDTIDQTPLIWACARGHLPAVNYLLHIGADANAANHVGWTSLHYSICYGHLDVVKSLVTAGGDTNWSDEDGTTPLHIACYHDRLKILKYLLTIGADIQKTEFNGTTSLHMASSKGHHNVISYILQLPEGGDLVNRPNARGETPLHIATSEGFTTIVDILVSHGGDLNARTNEGLTCLHLAAKLCNGPAKVEVNKVLSKLMAETPQGSLRPPEALVRLMMQKGADLNIRDKANKMPLDYISDEMGKLRVREGNMQASGKCTPKGSSSSSPNPAIPYEVLLRLANEIPNSKIHDLGNVLGFERAEIERFDGTNAMGAEITAKGTRALLVNWYDAMPKTDAVPKLIEALTKAGLVRQAEKYLKQ